MCVCNTHRCKFCFHDVQNHAAFAPPPAPKDSPVAGIRPSAPAGVVPVATAYPMAAAAPAPATVAVMSPPGRCVFAGACPMNCQAFMAAAENPAQCKLC